MAPERAAGALPILWSALQQPEPEVVLQAGATHLARRATRPQPQQRPDVGRLRQAADSLPSARTQATQPHTPDADPSPVTSTKSRVRESRTPGSVRGAGSNPRPHSACAGKADGSWWVRVPPAQSLVDRAEPSLACAPVTAWTKRRQGPYGVRVVSLERERNAEAEAVPEAEGSMSCSSAPPARAMTLRRGQGPHHVWKASIGTQEARPGPSAGPRGGHVATLTPE